MTERSTAGAPPPDAASPRDALPGDAAAASSLHRLGERFAQWIGQLEERCRRVGDESQTLSDSLVELSTLIDAHCGSCTFVQYLAGQPGDQPADWVGDSGEQRRRGGGERPARAQVTVLAAHDRSGPPRPSAGLPATESPTWRPRSDDRRDRPVAPGDDALADLPAAAAVSWRGTPPNRLIAQLPLQDHSRLVAEFSFEAPPSAEVSKSIEPLVQAALDLWMPLVLRLQLAQMRQRMSLAAAGQRAWSAAQASDGWQAAAALCRQIAGDTAAERVSMLWVQRSAARLLASSALVGVGPKAIDRRAEHIGQLERLAAKLAAEPPLAPSPADAVADGVADRDRDAVGDAESAIVADYRRQSGAVRVDVERIDWGQGQAVLLVAEDFQSAEPPRERSDARHRRLLAPYRPAVAAAAGRCIWQLSPAGRLAQWLGLTPPGNVLSNGRDRRGRWGWWRGRWQRRALVAVALLAIGSMPVPLRVQANGRLVPQQRQRIFAPADGLVTSLSVRGGQDVVAGQPLVQLHSATLDLAQQQLIGSIATARVQLAAGLASRAQASVGSSREGRHAGSLGSGLSVGGLSGGGDGAGQEEQLKAQLAGLEQQLRLIEAQQAALQVNSPVDGRVLGWDLASRLQHRPVAAGQHLMDVVAVDGGWAVHVEVPEEEIGYVLAARRAAEDQQGPECRFRLRSHPEVEYRGRLSELSAAAQPDGQGRPIVLAIAPIEPAGQGRHGGASGASGATVPLSGDDGEVWRVDAGALVAIDCGRRPLVMVYTRGLVRWGRAQLGW